MCVMLQEAGASSSEEGEEEEGRGRKDWDSSMFSDWNVILTTHVHLSPAAYNNPSQLKNIIFFNPLWISV